MSYYSTGSSYPPSSSNTAGYYGSSNTSNAQYSTGQWQQQQNNDSNASQQSQQQPATPQYNQWQPHQVQQMQQQQQQQQQQQHYSSLPPPQQPMAQQPQAGWDPSMAAMMAASAAAWSAGGAGGGSGSQFPSQMAGQLVSDMSKSFLRESWIRIIPGLEAFLVTLRTYFAVDNKYVLQKIKTILFPFLKKTWNRNVKGYGGPDGMTPMHDLPIADENAPDLYLPFMSLITYVLLCALVYGNAGKFNPEVIPDVTTKCFVTQIVEVLLVRLGIYALVSAAQQQQPYNQQQPLVKVVAWLDLLSYSGYKYLGLSVNMFLGLLAHHFSLGARAYYIAFLYTASAASYFMYRTIQSSVLETATYAAPSMGKGTTNQQILVLVIAAAQFATMWFVSQTKNL